MGGLNQLTGVLGHQRMRWEDKQHRKNREAEEAHARKVVWNAGDEVADDEMGDQIQIGDTSHQHYHGEQARGSGLAKTILCAGLAAAGLGLGAAAPIVAYNLTKQPTTEEPASDADTKYGLRIYQEQQ